MSFSRLCNLFHKKPKGNGIHLSIYPKLTFTVQHDGSARIDACWVRPRNNEELDFVVKAIGGMLVALMNTNLVAMAEEAIGAYGQQNNDRETALCILHNFRSYVNSVKPVEDKELGKKPCVRPSEIFKQQ